MNKRKVAFGFLIIGFVVLIINIINFNDNYIPFLSTPFIIIALVITYLPEKYWNTIWRRG